MNDSAHKMTIRRGEGGWWIADDLPPDVEPMGPYRSRRAAAEDRAGLLRCFRSPAWRAIERRRNENEARR